ncbi:hypothetical protein T4B_9903, partial [Trichinella pseudospiralis]
LVNLIFMQISTCVLYVTHVCLVAQVVDGQCVTLYNNVLEDFKPLKKVTVNDEKPSKISFNGNSYGTVVNADMRVHNDVV